MPFEMRRGSSVERPHCDGDPVPRRWIPEQERTACRAEPAPDAWGRLIPAHMLFASEDEGRPRNVCGGEVVAGLLSALDTVTRVGRTQVS